MHPPRFRAHFRALGNDLSLRLVSSGRICLAVEVSLCSETGARECSSGLQKSESIVKLLSRPKSQHFTFFAGFFAEELLLIPENGIYIYIGPARGKDWAELPSWAAFRSFVPAWTSQKPPIFGNSIFAGLLYNLQATTNYYYYCLIAPPLDLTYLILSRT